MSSATTPTLSQNRHRRCCPPTRSRQRAKGRRRQQGRCPAAAAKRWSGRGTGRPQQQRQQLKPRPGACLPSGGCKMPPKPREQTTQKLRSFHWQYQQQYPLLRPRPASVTLTQLSLWAAARPTTPAASAALRCGRISAAGPYEPAPHPKLDHAACDAADAPCALCERSQCHIGTDCYGPNTAAVSNYFPCTCTCKPGTWGAKCEWPFVVPLGASSNAGPDAEGIYYSEYIGVCQASPMTQPAALSACATRRDADGTGGWGLASFATGESLRRVQAQLAALLAANVGADTWVGDVDPTSIGSWRWAAGRLKDFGEFHVNSLGCRSISYLLKEPIFDRCSLWGTGRPNNSTSPVYAFLANALGRRMQDVPATATARCYACDRSRCQLGLDCLEHNLAEMRGDYYPSCSCVCKIGAWGDRCEWPLIVDQGNYVSEYRHIAAPAGITQAKADGTCADMLGAGWHAATFPTATSFATRAAQCHCRTRGLVRPRRMCRNNGCGALGASKG